MLIFALLLMCLEVECFNRFSVEICARASPDLAEKIIVMSCFVHGGKKPQSNGVW